MDHVLAGRYVLEVPLGANGSGEVWRGTDMVTNRPVAVEFAEISQVDDATLLAETISRFRQEAAALAALRNPRIAAAIDAGRIGNQLFMVAELAPGVSLAAMMDERGARGLGLFPVASVLHMAEQVCDGLADAHAAGAVHRNLRPDTVIVAPSLEVKVTGFGVARLLGDNATRLARRAQAVSEIAYLSPEQAQGLDLDGRADLYSLGCMLYQLLSGRLPFFSALPSALLMMQVMELPVPLASLRGDLPPQLTALVSELMEKDPAARPADARQVAGRLAEIRGELGEEPEPLLWDDIRPATALSPVFAGGFTRADLPVVSPLYPVSPPAASLLTPPNGQPSRSRELLSSPTGPLVPSQTGPIRSLPQAVARTGPGTGPSLPAPSRRRLWPAVLAAVLAVAVAAGAGAYHWLRTHQPLKITSVAVTAANPAIGCNGTARLVGVIDTNGRSGPVTYQWVLNQSPQDQHTAYSSGGSSTVRVTLDWSFHGKGTGRDVARLDILTPQRAQSSLTFPYACPR